MNPLLVQNILMDIESLLLLYIYRNHHRDGWASLLEEGGKSESEASRKKEEERDEERKREEINCLQELSHVLQLEWIRLTSVPIGCLSETVIVWRLQIFNTFFWQLHQWIENEI